MSQKRKLARSPGRLNFISNLTEESAFNMLASDNGFIIAKEGANYGRQVNIYINPKSKQIFSGFNLVIYESNSHHSYTKILPI